MRALLNSLIQSVGGVILVGGAATLAAYALSRSSIPGKGVVTYMLLLFSSVVSGSAAMVPIFLIVSSVRADRHPSRGDPRLRRRAVADRDVHPARFHRRHSRDL